MGSLDTSAESEAKLQELYANMSGSEKVAMLDEMFELAKELKLARIKQLFPNASEQKLKFELVKAIHEVDVAQMFQEQC